MPFGVQIAKSVLVQLGPELEEAARISGGSWLQCYRRVLIPLLTPTLIVVGLLGFMSAARDISTVVLVGSSQSRTMALLALDYAFGGQFERGSVVAFMTSTRCHRHRFDLSFRRQQGGHRPALGFQAQL